MGSATGLRRRSRSIPWWRIRVRALAPVRVQFAHGLFCLRLAQGRFGLRPAMQRGIGIALPSRHRPRRLLAAQAQVDHLSAHERASRSIQTPDSLVKADCIVTSASSPRLLTFLDVTREWPRNQRDSAPALNSARDEFSPSVRSYPRVGRFCRRFRHRRSQVRSLPPAGWCRSCGRSWRPWWRCHTRYAGQGR